MRQKSKQVIERWIRAYNDEPRASEMPELHIDRIDPRWEKNAGWIENGLKALTIALKLRAQHRINCTIALGFSLQSSDHPIGIDFGTASDLTNKLDWSPPSLNLYYPGDEPQNQVQRAIKDGTINNDAAAFKLDANIFRLSTAAKIKSCYYLEFRRRSETEYTRSVFIEG